MNWLKKTILFLVTFLVLFICAIYFIEVRKYSGVMLHNHSNYGKVEIFRDSYGIPHIKSKTLKGALFGQGFAHGQDRLFQIFLKTQLALGQLGALLGEPGLQYDIFFRTIGINRVAEKVLEKISKSDIELMQAYCDGINFYSNSLTFPTLEFLITGAKFENFTPKDIIANERLMIVLLGYDYILEPTRTKIAEQYGFEFSQFLTVSRSDALFADVTVTNDEELKQEGLYDKFVRNNSFNQKKPQFSEQQKAGLLTSTLSAVLYDMLQIPHGSNAWVIHGNHTKSGKPLLASDPHMSNSIPACWVMNEILIEDGNIVTIGSSMPGMPLVQNGRSNYVSWGTTVLYSDTSDLYKEKIQDDKYLLDGKWVDLVTHQETIEVKGRTTPHKLDVKYTHRGPILSFKFNKLSSNPLIEIGMEASLSWNGHIEDSTIISALVQLSKAQNPTQVKKAFGKIIGPSLSVVYATIDGHIGFYGYGRIPVIKDSQMGAFVKDGTTSELDWQRFTIPEEAPQVFNPQKGYIVTANNRFATDNLKNHLSVNSLATPRALRITELIEEHIKKGLKFDIGDMKRIQSDQVDIFAKMILPTLISLFKSKAKSSLSEKQYQKANKMVNLISDWNYEMATDNFKASIFMSWEYIFVNKCLQAFNLTTDDRQSLLHGKFFEHFYLSAIRSVGNGEKLRFGEEWCINEENKSKENPCLYNILSAFAEVEVFLTKKFNSADPTSWYWGKLHKHNYPHTAYDKISGLNALYNRQLEGFGNRRTIAVSIQDWSKQSFDATFGANYRMIIDMKENSNNDLWILDTGNSESILSPHYDDQMKLHRKFEYLQMKRGFSLLNQNNSNLLVLQPETESKNQSEKQNLQEKSGGGDL